MGGKALGFETVRLQKCEFTKIQNEVVSILSQKFDVVLPTLYDSLKESFGDLDLIVPRPVPIDIVEWLTNAFDSKKVVYNGESLQNAMSVSFEYQKFQIDLIFVHPDNLKIAHFYYYGGDMNNYVGRVAAQFCMKFGFNGLYYEMPGHDFLISKDPKKIYEFLGFDYSKYEAGFETLNEIFEYVTSSKYFNSEIYQIENLNHINRTRNLKRPNYLKFLDYLVLHGLTGDAKYPDRETSVNMIDAYFPESKLHWQLMKHDNKQMRLIKIRETLNAESVREQLKVSWETTRSVIDQIFSAPNVDAHLVGLNENQLKSLVKASYEKIQKTVELKVGDKVYFRTNDHRFVESVVETVNEQTYGLRTDELFFYDIRKERVKLIEHWFDFKNQLLCDVI